MKCPNCNVEYSKKVYRIHISMCGKRYAEDIKELDEIVLERCTKRDLMLYIMSESHQTEEELKVLKKAELLSIAQKIRDSK